MGFHNRRRGLGGLREGIVLTEIERLCDVHPHKGCNQRNLEKAIGHTFGKAAGETVADELARGLSVGRLKRMPGGRYGTVREPRS